MMPRSREDLDAHLSEQILTGRLAAGSKLPAERALADEFGVSRPIVREVLHGLQERGLVSILPARGTFVRQASPADGAGVLESFYRRQATARNLVEARLMLEMYAVGLAAERATPAEIVALERCLRDFDNATHVVDRASHDVAFHGLIAQCTHNAVITTMFASISALTFELMLRSLSDPDVSTAGAPIHHAILDAIRAGDGPAAQAAMERHVGLAGHMFGSDLDAPVDETARREVNRLLGPHVSLDRLLADVGRRQAEAAADEASLTVA
jgi:DNA-binding FadR family transcriptional regulator